MFIFEHMFFPISRLPSPLLVLPYPKLPSGWAAFGCHGQAAVWLACFVWAWLRALVCAHVCVWAHTHTRARVRPFTWGSVCGVHVPYQLKEGRFSEAARVCEQILNQAEGSLLSKTRALVRDGSWALYAYWEGKISDRRLLPSREILGWEFGMGSTWFSIQA